MQEIEILEELFDKKIIEILKCFFRDQAKEQYLQEISKKSNVSMASCSRILSKLERLEIIEVKMVSRFKLYKLDENDKVKFLSKLFKEDLKVMQKFAGAASKIKGIKAIILHGKEQKDRANVLLIGENINPGEVKALCSEINNKYKFIISPLALTADQYNQMSQMGLYSGQKRILWQSE